MPSNIENANISALKLGTATVTKGYIGHQEVYPNTREIQSAVFTNTSLANNATSFTVFPKTPIVSNLSETFKTPFLEINP